MFLDGTRDGLGSRHGPVGARDERTCLNCGTVHPAPAASCRVCEAGHAKSHRASAWAASSAIGARHEVVVSEAEPALRSLAVEPALGLAQRALYLDGVLYDCVPAFTADAAATVDALGGLSSIVILHPLGFGAAAQWAREFSVPIVVHRDTVPFTPDRAHIDVWEGERLALADDTVLVRLAGRATAGVIAHWRAGADGRGSLLASDNLHVLAHGEGVAFMWSHALAIPLAAHDVTSLVSQLGRLDFDRLYGSLWNRAIRDDAKAKVVAAAGRYLDALG